MAKARTLDFTNVKERSQYSKKRQPEGDYRAKIVSVATVKKKKAPHDEQWIFGIKVGSVTMPYYCGFGADELWKIRNLFMAAGVSIPKKRFQTDPNKVVNKYIGLTLEDDEYDGKPQSNIAAVFPESELDNVAAEADDEDEDDDEEEGEDATSDDDDDEEDEDTSDDSEDEDEDDDDEEEAPAPPPARKKKARRTKPAADLEELDIEDV